MCADSFDIHESANHSRDAMCAESLTFKCQEDVILSVTRHLSYRTLRKRQSQPRPPQKSLTWKSQKNTIHRDLRKKPLTLKCLHNAIVTRMERNHQQLKFQDDSVVTSTCPEISHIEGSGTCNRNRHMRRKSRD